MERGTTPEPETQGASDRPAVRRFSQQAIHLVRTSQTNNLALSQMADQKASILMGATFVVFSIAVGQASQGIMPISLSVLAIFAFASAICAVMAVLPSTRGKHQRADSKSNRLFFGVFSQASEEEWVEDMLDTLGSDEAIYRAMLRDIYQNGQVMARKKYRFLGYAYRLFIAGLCTTFAVFLLERFVLN
ncbi:Pycsar system effector family protein [Croceicoccus sediminis]|uniref:Pycsar system effector family protein n=1 Tax=Croceicoccus sediminis TaxID=2571150 RepID=UPI001F0F02F4|nr:Pycsar system effector family protein [Croceicoccus sediminis]